MSQADPKNKVEQEMPTFEEFSIPTYDEWRQAAEKALKGASFDEKLVTQTYEGIEIHPLYRQENIQNLPHAGSLPGFAPYVRGTRTLGYLARPWEVAQEIKAPTPKEFNRQARHDLERGQTMLNLVLDKPSLSGMDPDQADMGEVMTHGLSIFSLEDLETALDGIDLERIPVYIQAGPSALPLIAFVAALMEKRNLRVDQLRGCIGADPIGFLAAEGTLKNGLDSALDAMAKTVLWSEEFAPHVQTISVQGHPYHNGGAHAVQELAFTLAAGVEYILALQERGIDINRSAKQIGFSFSVGSHFFMEIAKIRAARMLWANIIQAFGGDEEAQKMRIHARTSSWNKTLHDPYVNMLRGTAEAFAGVVAGVDSLHVAPFDEVLRESDEFSRRISRNIQLILESEAHLGRVIDPAGGSWYVEALTDEVAQKTWELFQKVEAEGGMLASLLSGWPQQHIAEVFNKRLANISRRKEKIVGTNMYPNLQEPKLASQNGLTDKKKARVESVLQFRKNRQLADTPASPGSFSVRQAIQQVQKGATLGQITKLFQNKDASCLTVRPVLAARAAEPFEALRAAAESFKEKTGALPQVFLANMGSIGQYKARADFCTGFFQVGGFQVQGSQGFAETEDAVQAAAASGALVTIICSSDEAYPDIVPTLSKQLKEKCPGMTVMVAGQPAAERMDQFKQAGVDDFIHIRSNCYEMLFQLQQQKGISR
ncbi:methylmalonyl-CoA mutase family protein [Ammoniphilus sp. 3BR4]|uniref:methylmalonyl-CoA mutase family protein n=1 Tax=Ammoniphilus sp. 3BR4 TaxID=3158265 RepID=UPI003465C2DC